MSSVSRLIWLLVVALVVPALVVGTGGFSAATLDRGVTVSVADHDQAAVSLWDPGARDDHSTADVPRDWLREDPVTDDDPTTTLVVVKNRLGHSIDVTASAVDAPAGVTVASVEAVTLEPGDVGRVDATVDCGDRTGGVQAPIDLRVHADGEGFAADIDYQVHVVCGAPGDPGGSSTAAT